MVEAFLSEASFQKCIKLGIYTESDRDIRVNITRPLKTVDNINKYEKEQPNSPLNMRWRYIEKYGIIDGIKVKPFKEYFGV